MRGLGYAIGMTDPSFIPEGDRELLAVYPTFEEASRARTEVIDARAR